MLLRHRLLPEFMLHLIEDGAVLPDFLEVLESFMGKAYWSLCATRDDFGHLEFCCVLSLVLPLRRDSDFVGEEARKAPRSKYPLLSNDPNDPNDPSFPFEFTSALVYISDPDR